MSNVWNEAKKQPVIARGRLGWPLRRIEQETGVRRETARAYLFSCNFAFAIFGEVTPPFVSLLAHRNRINPAHYVGMSTVAGMAAILLALSVSASDQAGARGTVCGRAERDEVHRRFTEVPPDRLPNGG